MIYINNNKKINNFKTFILENQNTGKTWFHGSFDTRELLKQGGFSVRRDRVRIVKDLDKYNKLKEQMDKYYGSDEYFEILEEVSSLIEDYSYTKPVFFTDKKKVAYSYAEPKRSIDYQSAEEGVIETNIFCKKTCLIQGQGRRFRLLPVENVIKGFVNSGVHQKDISLFIDKLNFDRRDSSVISTDKISVLGHEFGFDCIDLQNIEDSYHQGGTLSTIRMVLDPSIIKILGVS
jgi:hypothetical protein